MIPAATNTSKIQKPFSTERSQTSRESPGLAGGQYKATLEEFTVPESEEMLKKQEDRDRSSRQGSPPKQAS